MANEKQKGPSFVGVPKDLFCSDQTNEYGQRRVTLSMEAQWVLTILLRDRNWFPVTKKKYGGLEFGVNTMNFPIQSLFRLLPHSTLEEKVTQSKRIYQGLAELEDKELIVIHEHEVTINGDVTDLALVTINVQIMFGMGCNTFEPHHPTSVLRHLVSPSQPLE